MELRFSEAVTFTGSPGQFTLRSNSVEYNNYTLRSAANNRNLFVTYCTDTSQSESSCYRTDVEYSVISSFRGGESSTAATDVEAGDNSTRLVASFPLAFGNSDAGIMNLLRLSYTQGEADGGVLDNAGNELPGIDLDGAEGRWVPGNVHVPNTEAAPQDVLQDRAVQSPGPGRVRTSANPVLAFGRVVDSTHVALIFTEPIVASGDLTAAFQLRGNAFHEDLRLHFVYSTSSSGEFSSSYTTIRGHGSGFSSQETYGIAEVYPLANDEANAVLILKLSDALSADADGNTGFLRLSYSDETSASIVDRSEEPKALENIFLAEQDYFAGNVVDQLGPPALVRGFPKASGGGRILDGNDQFLSARGTTLDSRGGLDLHFTAPVTWGGGDPSDYFTLRGTTRNDSTYNGKSYFSSEGNEVLSSGSANRTSTTYLVEWGAGGVVNAPSWGAAASVENDDETGVRQNILSIPLDVVDVGTGGSNRIRVSYTPGAQGLLDADGAQVPASAFALEAGSPGNVFFDYTSQR